MSGQPPTINGGSRARFDSPEESKDAHITSLVVHTKPTAVSGIAANIDASDNAEVHFADPSGKLVVSLETDTLYEVTSWVDRVTALDGVITATLVYHQIEDKHALDQPMDAGTPGVAGPAGEETSK